MTNKNDLILVTGATGKTGGRVVEQLQARGLNVRIGSRRATPAFDWQDQATWWPSLDGVACVYVSFQPDLCVPGALQTLTAFFAQAVAMGVKKLVLLSGRGEIEAQQAEEALKASGVADWTILRASWFMQNFSESVFLEPILAGELALPAGPVPEPFVDVDDIAEIAVAALTTDAHAGKLYELTGPSAHTFADAAAMIGRAVGRDIAFHPIAAEDYRVEAVAMGAPEEIADLVVYLFTTVLDGRNTPLGDGVREALDRAPRSFADYVARTAATGVWSHADV